MLSNRTEFLCLTKTIQSARSRTKFITQTLHHIRKYICIRLKSPFYFILFYLDTNTSSAAKPSIKCMEREFSALKEINGM